MKNVRLLIICVLLVQPAVAGGTVTESYTFAPGAPIPDYVIPGVALLETIAGSQIRNITDVDVELVINHTSNGQVYAMLLHGSEVVMLLDAVGSIPGLPLGYDDDGFNIVVDDEGLDDGLGTGIHQYQLITGGTLPPGMPLTGVWAPDLDGTNGTLPDYPLSEFDGMDADGPWTLVVSDCGLGEIGVVVQWSLFLEGDTVATAVGDTLLPETAADEPVPRGRTIWNEQSSAGHQPRRPRFPRLSGTGASSRQIVCIQLSNMPRIVTVYRGCSATLDMCFLAGKCLPADWAG